MKKDRTKKSISIFYLVSALAVTAFLLVIYINSIIEVNRLSSDNNLIKSEINKLKQVNDLLRTEGEHLTSYERIKQLAVSQGLAYRDSAVSKKPIIIRTGN